MDTSKEVTSKTVSVPIKWYSIMSKLLMVLFGIITCNGDYWPKSSTMLFIFDVQIKFWSIVVMHHIKTKLELNTTFWQLIA